MATILLVGVDLFFRGKLEALLEGQHLVTSDSVDTPDLVLVDIARLYTFDFWAKGQDNPWEPARYAAWIVPPAGKGDVTILDLGPAEEIDAVVEHVLAVSGQENDATLAAAGATVFAENCAACHGDKVNAEPSKRALREDEDEKPALDPADSFHALGARAPTG